MTSLCSQYDGGGGDAVVFFNNNVAVAKACKGKATAIFFE